MSANAEGAYFTTLVVVRDRLSRAFQIGRMLNGNGIEAHVWPCHWVLRLMPSRFQRHLVMVTQDDLPRASRLLTESGLLGER